MHMPTSSLGTLADMAFPYTCVVGDNGKDSLTITLPTARYDTNYIAKASLDGPVGAYWYSCVCPPSGYTTTTITLVTGSPVATGDVIGILITERTS